MAARCPSIFHFARVSSREAVPLPLVLLPTSIQREAGDSGRLHGLAQLHLNFRRATPWLCSSHGHGTAPFSTAPEFQNRWRFFFVSHSVRMSPATIVYECQKRKKIGGNASLERRACARRNASALTSGLRKVGALHAMRDRSSQNTGPRSAGRVQDGVVRRRRWR